jgi:hypothetical protein
LNRDGYNGDGKSPPKPFVNRYSASHPATSLQPYANPENSSLNKCGTAAGKSNSGQSVSAGADGI